MTSTIKVNNVQNQCGTDIIKRCGSTTTVGSGAGNTVVICGSTVTIGRCGATVQLASGAQAVLRQRLSQQQMVKDILQIQLQVDLQ